MELRRTPVSYTHLDMLQQVEQVQKMGSLGSIMKMIPGLNQFASQMDDEKTTRQMNRSKAIIRSMTKEDVYKRQPEFRTLNKERGY